METSSDDQRWPAVQGLVKDITDEEGFELVELQVKRAKGRFLLRVFIDKSGGVGINDCEGISNMIGAVLDRLDIIPGPYTLEVSSPGLDRPLKKQEDFIRFNGRWIRITFNTGDTMSSTLEGKIIQYSNELLTIENKKGDRFDIPYPNILKARLIIKL